MTSLAIKTTRDGGQSVVLRRHDLSGCDYEGLLPVSSAVAEALTRTGVVIWASQPPSASGKPGIVLSASDDSTATLQVRADVADPTTVIGETSIALSDALSCVALDSSTTIQWVVPPRAA